MSYDILLFRSYLQSKGGTFFETPGSTMEIHFFPRQYLFENAICLTMYSLSNHRRISLGIFPNEIFAPFESYQRWDFKVVHTEYQNNAI